MRKQKIQYAALGLMFGVLLFIGLSTFAANGQWSIGNGFLIFKQQGSTSDVYVGIGESNPSAKLEVNGKIKMESTVDADSFNTVVTKDYLSAILGKINAGKWIEDESGNITRSIGNIGIGVTTPSEKLHIGGNILVDSSLLISDKGVISSDNDGLSLISTTGKTVVIRTTDAPTGGITIGSNGNIEIGASSNNSPTLSVGGIFDFNNIKWDSGENINLAGTGEYSFDFSEGSGASTLSIWSPSGTIFTAKSDGKVSIGAGNNPVAKLEVGGNIKIGEDNTICDASHAGEIKFSAGQFQGCTGTAWVNLH